MDPTAAPRQPRTSQPSGLVLLVARGPRRGRRLAACVVGQAVSSPNVVRPRREATRAELAGAAVGDARRRRRPPRRRPAGRSGAARTATAAPRPARSAPTGRRTRRSRSGRPRAAAGTRRSRWSAGGSTRQDRQGGTERVLCLDAETGTPLWEHGVAGRLRRASGYGAGPRATPTVHEGRRLRRRGDRQVRLPRSPDRGAADRGRLWEHDLPASSGPSTPTWGVACSPLIEGDLVDRPAGRAGRVGRRVRQGDRRAAVGGRVGPERVQLPGRGDGRRGAAGDRRDREVDPRRPARRRRGPVAARVETEHNGQHRHAGRRRRLRVRLVRLRQGVRLLRLVPTATG